MTASFRTGEIGDAEILSRIFAETFHETFAHLYSVENLDRFLTSKTPEAFARDLADSAFTYRVAMIGSELCGYVKLGPAQLPTDAPEETLEICQIYVLCAYHGQGIAQQLIDWAKAAARQRGARFLQLGVFPENHRARRFYMRNGFVDVGPTLFMVGDQADEDMIMRASL